MVGDDDGDDAAARVAYARPLKILEVRGAWLRVSDEQNTPIEINRAPTSRIPKYPEKTGISRDDDGGVLTARHRRRHAQFCHSAV